MPVQPGARLGPYTIVSVLGAGGMGEVWRARDTRLGREVALKVLPEELASDPDRLARFDREARILASLSHPNIAAIHGLEEAEGVRALVLELVEGPTLAERIAQGPIEHAEACSIARQIADALEAAHERGIVHRDLKPANVKVRSDGTVKVLDFGLAKALAPDVPVRQTHDSASPTALLSPVVTQLGVLLGTAAYMSPEQARGRPADKRADIWAFGCVLYEMLAGRRAFAGGDLSTLLAEVMKEEPAWSRLPRDAPEPIRRLLRRCLDKDARTRLRDIGEARIVLAAVISKAEDPAEGEPVARTVTRWPWLALAAAVVLASVALLTLHDGGETERPPRAGWTFGLSQSAAPTTEIISPLLALSPDGSRLVFVSRAGGPPRLYVRRTDDLDARPLEGTAGASNPFLSPDGRQIGFFAGQELKRIPIDGGPVQSICELPPNPYTLEGSRYGASWADDGTVVFASGLFQGLFRVAAAGGVAEPVTELDGERGDVAHMWPQVLPGSRWLLYTAAWAPGFDQAAVLLVDLERREERTLVEKARFGRYLPSGHLLHARPGTLYAMPFSIERGEVLGSPIPVLSGVATHPITGSAQFAVAQVEGTLVYLPEAGERGASRSLVWVDRGGLEAVAIESVGHATAVALAPGDERIAVSRLETGGPTVVVLDPTGAAAEVRINYRGPAALLDWSPDGDEILLLIFGMAGSDPRTRSREPGEPPWSGRGFEPVRVWADGRGEIASVELDLEPAERMRLQYLSSWRGSRAAYVQSAGVPGQLGFDIGVVDLETGAAELIVGSPANEEQPRLSPDGRWIAYVSDEDGGHNVYVQPVTADGGKWRVSRQQEGGTSPLWSSDGLELYYRSLDGDTVFALSVDATGPVFRHSEAVELFSGDYYLARDSYDVAQDGRFLMIRENGGRMGQLVVRQGWLDELRESRHEAEAE